MNILNSMQITAKTESVLVALIENRKKHLKIVIEARVGYAKKAREVLLDQLGKLEAGKISVVNFSLVAPQDYTKVYDTAIEMLRLHTGETVTLDSSQVRTLMMDEWDWKLRFISTNSVYSDSAAAAFEPHSS